MNKLFQRGDIVRIQGRLDLYSVTKSRVIYYASRADFYRERSEIRVGLRSLQDGNCLHSRPELLEAVLPLKLLAECAE